MAAPHAPFTPADVASAIRLYVDQMESIAVVAGELRCAKATARDLLTSHGVRIRARSEAGRGKPKATRRSPYLDKPPGSLPIEVDRAMLRDCAARQRREMRVDADGIPLCRRWI